MNSVNFSVVSVPVIDLRATGQNILRLRKAAGLSVRDLQMILGFTNPQAIYKWQNGDSLPAIDNLVILAAVFGVTVDDILVVDGGVSVTGLSVGNSNAANDSTADVVNQQ